MPTGQASMLAWKKQKSQVRRAPRKTIFYLSNAVVMNPENSGPLPYSLSRRAGSVLVHLCRM